jgi:hypothetical protein
MKRPRKSASLSQSVHDRLNMYALAASAAGVTLLALAPPSEAEIIYTKAYHVIPKGGHYNLDLNHDGKTDFSFVDRFSCTEDFCPNALSVNPIGENGVEGRQGFLEKWAYALPQGAHIGPRHPFSGQVMASSDAGYLGSWVNVTNRYLGFKFKIRGATHYGWARLDVSVTKWDRCRHSDWLRLRNHPQRANYRGQNQGAGCRHCAFRQSRSVGSGKKVVGRPPRIPLVVRVAVATISQDFERVARNYL